MPCVFLFFLANWQILWPPVQHNKKLVTRAQNGDLKWTEWDQKCSRLQ